MLIKTRLFSAAAFLLLLAGVQTQHGVTFSSQSLCVVTGSTVKIPCKLTTPDYFSVTQRQWYRVKSSEEEPQDLIRDPQYLGRVSGGNWRFNCELTVKDVRVSDSGFYNFRFKTQYSEWISATSEVNLTVTDLKVTVSDSSYRSQKILSCITSCTNKLNFIWYKNGQQVKNENRNQLFVYTGRWDKASFSCAIKGHETHRSLAVCAGCWSVSYFSESICSLIGSSVDINSYFTFPGHHTVRKVIWFVKEQVGVEPVDLREDNEYRGRVQYFQNFQNCRLRIINLTERDAQTYRFRFYTDSDKYTSQFGVTLSVTDLKITVFESYHEKRLSCVTSCSLSNKPSYIWYKNGQPYDDYRNEPYLYVKSEDASMYYCAVRGYEELRSPAVYSPKNTRAVLLFSGDATEGNPVTLSCSSDANPPVLTYTWFKQRALLTTSQNYSISNINSLYSGQYYCMAQNQLGQHRSTPIHLDSPKNTSALVLPSGDTVEGDSVTLSCSSDANPPVLTFTWFKQTAAADTLLTTGQNYSITNISSNHSGLYYCTAHNQLGQHTSMPTNLKVLYPPRNLSVTVVSFVSGDLVTLTCTSDSNPTSSYTWYKKTERDVILAGNGTNLTLSSGEDGFYYCTAMNRFGSSNSSEWTNTSDNSTLKYTSFGVVAALVLMFLAVYLWMRRRVPVASSRSQGNSGISNSAPVYDNISAMAMTSDLTHTACSEDQDDVQYSRVCFTSSNMKNVPLYSTVQMPNDLSEEQGVEYATVNFEKRKTCRMDVIYRNLKVKECKDSTD